MSGQALSDSIKAVGGVFPKTRTGVGLICLEPLLKSM